MAGHPDVLLFSSNAAQLEGGQMLQWERWTCYSGEGGQMLQWGRWTDVTVGKVDRCYSGEGGQMLQWERWTDVTVGKVDRCYSGAVVN